MTFKDKYTRFFPSLLERRGERSPYASVSVQTERDREVQEAIGARKPEPVPATKQLRTNLENAALAYLNRDCVLVKEIAEREAELADVRRARDATTAALLELDVDLPELEVTDEAPPAPKIESISVEAATGEQLDALGSLYSLRRRGPNEPDDEYRGRIRREYHRVTEAPSHD